MKRPLFTLFITAGALLAALTIVHAAIPTHDVTLGSGHGGVGMAEGNAAWTAEPSIMAVLDSHPELADFRRAVEEAGLSEALSAKGPFTVFVPSDEAFGHLPGPVEQKILDSRRDSGELVKNQVSDGYLLYGVSDPKLSTMDLARVGYIVTQDGNRIPVTVTHHRIQVGGARLVEANIKASNGVIHVVDEVNLPADIR